MVDPCVVCLLVTYKAGWFQLSLDLGGGEMAVSRYKLLADELRREHEQNKPNPVIQRVKLIMVRGLCSQPVSNTNDW